MNRSIFGILTLSAALTAQASIVIDVTAKDNDGNVFVDNITLENTPSFTTPATILYASSHVVTQNGSSLYLGSGPNDYSEFFLPSSPSNNSQSFIMIDVYGFEMGVTELESAQESLTGPSMGNYHGAFYFSATPVTYQLPIAYITSVTISGGDPFAPILPPTPVPESSTFALVGSASLIAAVLYKRRRK